MLKLREISLLIFLFAGVLFALQSCKDEDKFGAELLPAEDIVNSYFTDTISIKGYTVSDEQLRTDNFTNILLGGYTDPVFGKTKAEFTSQVRTSGVKIRIDERTFADSMTIELVLDTVRHKNAKYYGKIGKPMNISVHRVREDIKMMKDNKIVPYYSNTSFQYDEVPLSSYCYTPSIRDSIVSLPLPIDFAQELLAFAKISKQYFVNNDTLNTIWKGLAFRVDDNSTEGAIMTFVKNKTKIRLYYHNDTTHGAFNFYINDNSGRAASFTHDFSGTPLEQQIQQPISSDSVMYIQALGGVKAKLNFPFLQNLKQKNKKIVINKAQLTVNVANDNTRARFELPSELTLVYMNDEEYYLDEYTFTDSRLRTHHYSEKYNEPNNYYQFDIPVYIQKLLDGELEDKGLYIIPRYRVAQANRLIINNWQHKSGISLALTYTIL
ncbi:MAG: hypothetical protein CSA05_03345 [Bacteroidia bacterium]|nr:MAG: hypothetical protein CSA05_03345 [Bacteroidia bacterium]